MRNDLSTPMVPTHNLFALLTALWEQEEEVRRWEKRYRATFDQPPVGVAHVGPDLSFISVSDGFCAFTGYSRHDLLGMTFSSITHPDDVQPDLAQAERLAAGRLEGYALESRFLRRDGPTVWGHLTVTLLRDITGAALFHVAVVVDITERKEAEAAWLAARVELERERARLDILLRESPSGLAVAEAATGRIVYHNDEAIRLLRHPLVSASEHTGLTGYGGLHPDGTPYSRADYPLVRALDGEIVLAEEMLYCRGDGLLTHLVVSAAPVRDRAGNVIFGVSTVEDLSTRRRVTEELREVELREQLANRAKSTFLALMSHELRTPLTSILGFADLLLMGVPEQVGVEAHDQVERIRAAARQLLGLMDEVLAFARVEAGACLELDFDPVDLDAAIKRVVCVLEPTARTKGLLLRAGPVPPGLRVAANAERLEEILIHLTANAVKYTRHGAVEIDTERDDRTVTVTIRDTGIGIAPEELERIFEPRSEDGAGSGNSLGNGGGLTVAKRLARLLGGELRVESRLEKGSTVRLTLPVAPAPA